MTAAAFRWIRRGVFAFAALAFTAPLSTAQAGNVPFDGQGHAYHPVWSLDGRYLAFEVNRYAGDIDLFVSEVKGDIAQNAQKFALPGGSGFGSKGQVVINPTWHPDGIAVFEGSNQGGQMRLYFAQPGGSTAAEMLSTSMAPGHLTFPAVSPNGSFLAFVSNQTGNGDIYAWDRSTNKLEQLTSASATESFPLYSKDGSRVLFTRKQNDTEDVFEMVGGVEKPVAGGAGDQTRPAYGAGNKIVYFTSERGSENWDIAVVDGPGGAKKVLAQSVRLPLRARPALTPDGEWVAFVHDDPTKNMNLVLTKLDGSKTVTIPTEFTACGEPAITEKDGRIVMAFTALPNSDSDWRFLHVMDITDKL